MLICVRTTEYSALLWFIKTVSILQFLRIIPTAAHTLEDVNRTIEAFKAVREKFDAGVYASMPVPMKADPEFKVR